MSAHSCPLTFEDLKDAKVNSGALDANARCYICQLYAAQHRKYYPSFEGLPGRMSRDVSSGNLAAAADMSQALMIVNTRHHPSVFFGDRWQCCGVRKIDAPGCLQGDFVTSLSNFHHPSTYSTENDCWDCCCKIGKDAAGCQTGEVMHHPSPFTDTVGGTDMWFCCKKKQRFASGCTPGPHRSAYAESLATHQGTGEELQKTK